MSDQETGAITREGVLVPEDEAAAAKLWAVYVAEAERYDKALVESWKGDMEGLLIFAGLFSAVLTAFLIESYKTLISDPADLTVQLLAQISRQLPAPTIATPINVPPPIPFTPSPSSLVCNAFWFIALGFSLACALVATLVQQWAREFLHRANMRSAPVVRARVFAYLYYGMKRFRMHTVVGTIPLLLHASLLFFFSGLVAFLIPVNAIMTVIAGALLGIVTLVYCVLSVLPLQYLDCPYRTPLSGLFWSLLQGVRQFRDRYHRRSGAVPASGPDPEAQIGSSLTEREFANLGFAPSSSRSWDKTMLQGMSRAAWTENRRHRDYRALVWTMKSLTDNTELQLFVEAIPDLLWGPKYRRHTYENHIQRLIADPVVQLHNRIATLRESCDAGVLSAGQTNRRRITCCKALWAIASLAKPTQSPEQSNIAMRSDFTHIFDKFRVPFEDSAAPHHTSADVMMLWSMYCVVRGRLLGLQKDLETAEVDLISGGTPDITRISSAANEIYRKFGAMTYEFRPRLPQSATSQRTIPELRHMVEFWLGVGPYMILFQYLTLSAVLPSLPYRLEETISIIQLDDSIDFSSYKESFYTCLNNLLEWSMKESSKTSSDKASLAGINRGISHLLSLWRPEDPTPIPQCIIDRLNGTNMELVADIFEHGRDIRTHVWSNFPTTLLKGLASSREAEVLTALWRLSSLGSVFHYRANFNQLVAVLNAISAPSFFTTDISTSIDALLRVQMLHIKGRMTGTETVGDMLTKFNNLLPSKDSATQIPPKLIAKGTDAQVMGEEIRDWVLLLTHCEHEARMNIMAEYLESCSSENLPYKAAETLEAMDLEYAPAAAIHHTHQIRFANGVHSVFSADRFTSLLETIIQSSFWTVYTSGAKTEQEVQIHLREFESEQPVWPGDLAWPWLNNSIARRKIVEAFTDYAQKLAQSSDSPDILTKLRKILHGLSAWHPQPASMNS